MLERDIERYLVRRVKAAGGEVRKVKWIGRRHAPDRRVMLPNCAPFWVELKKPGEKLRSGQAREHERMRKFYEQVKVADSKAGVDEILFDHAAL